MNILYLVAFAATLGSCGVTERDNTASISGLEAENLSYQKLAKETVAPAYEQILADLMAFDEATLPHEAKALRKRIGKLRLYVDVFPFAYGKKDGVDVWAALRNDLDVGYESMGEFKDIFDAKGITLASKDKHGNWTDGVRPEKVVYSDGERAEIESQRKDVLKWVKSFTAMTLVKSTKSYLKDPKQNLYNKRSRDSLSRFVWGAVGIKPKKSLRGVDNIARLVKKQLSAAKKLTDKVISVKNLTKDHDDEEAFHDFRKRVRASLKLIDAFPIQFDEDDDAEQRIEKLTEMVSRFGEINDVLIRYHKEQKASKRKKIAKRIDKEWDSLRDWCKDSDVRDQIGKLAKMINY